MVLPPELLPVYRERSRYYNQTSSKTEQIALCQFIRDGHLESQIRKARKLYTAKAKKLCEDIGRIFGDRAVPHLGEAGFLEMCIRDRSPGFQPGRCGAYDCFVSGVRPSEG